MLIVGFLEWWYGAGWRQCIRQVSERLAHSFDFFSIDLLLATWFAPFRQIGAQVGGTSFPDQVRALGDQLVSRIIGGIVRTIMIIVGSVWLGVLAILGVVQVVMWGFLPIFPVVGALVFAIGWVPYGGL